MMDRLEKLYAIVLSGGSGSRMGSDIPKQYLPILNKPMLYYSLRAFEESEIQGIVLVTPPGEENYVQENIIKPYNIKKVKAIVSGGAARYLSVHCGLKAIDALGGSDYVLIHDGARPCLSQAVIASCIETVTQKGACTAAVRTVDTISIVDESFRIIQSPNRQLLWSVQTPQCFPYKDILLSHQMLSVNVAQMTEEKRTAITDDVFVYKTFTEKEVLVVPSSYENIKVTNPGDIQLAEQILINREERNRRSDYRNRSSDYRNRSSDYRNRSSE